MLSDEIDWSIISGETMHGRFKGKLDTTVFLAERHGSKWFLTGAFIPDASEPVECNSLAMVRSEAVTHWLAFRDAMMPPEQEIAR